MKLAVPYPMQTMEALSRASLPAGDGWQYEPKWDGFRCLVFRDKDEVELQSKAEKPLTRYFPEVVDAVRKLKAKRFVLDSELTIIRGNRLSFDDMLLRIHPAASRIRKLSAEIPGTLIVFDLLADEPNKPLLNIPLHERRGRLEAFAKKYFAASPALRLSPATTSLDDTKKWLKKAGTALDGIVAKRLDSPYCPGERDCVVKVKFDKTADCVIGGFRYQTGTKQVGSLLLGLYDEEGKLNHVGHTTVGRKLNQPELTRRLEALIESPGFTGRAPGGPSRWSQEAREFQPLRPELVIEVEYDHISGGRFRHGTKFLRWRPDKSPRQCTMEQLNQANSALLLNVR